MKTAKLNIFLIVGSCLILSSCNLFETGHGSIVNTATAVVYQPVVDQETGSYVSKQALTLDYGISSVYGSNKPMVSLTSFLKNFYMPNLQNPETKSLDLTRTDDVYTYTLVNDGKGTISVDFTNNKITFSNYYRVLNIYDSAFLDAAAVGLIGYDYLAYSSDNVGFIEAGNETVFDLGGYDIPLYKYREDAYLPIEVVSYLFLALRSSQVVFNGSAFYIYASPLYMIDSDGQLTNYGRDYYGGSLASLSTKSSAIATLEANEMIFYLDHFYGFRDTNTNVGSGWKNYLSSSYPSIYNNLYSTDADASASALDSILMTIIGDGHTGANNVYGNLGSFYNGGRHIRRASSSQRSLALNTEYSENIALRSEVLGSEELGDNDVQISGNTGIIRFDSFQNAALKSGQTTDYYREYKSYDNYALFVYAFRKFENSGVKRVVIDLTCNGGGTALSCVAALGFLMDTVPYATYCPLTGDKGQYRVNVDADADGTISGHDSYADKYEFYVLTSNYSFSCGNWFPTVCKDVGIKIIGAKSGGGACAVQYGVSPCGQPFQISGVMRLSNGYTGGEKDNDGGIDVDYTVAKEYWYDAVKLDSYLSSL